MRAKVPAAAARYAWPVLTTSFTDRLAHFRSQPTAAAGRRPRAGAAVAALALALTVLTGCSSEGAETDCSLDACTVTFDREVGAQASILGVEAKLVGVEGDQATVEVAGEELALTVGQAAVEAGGMQVSLKSVDDANVVVEIAKQ